MADLEIVTLAYRCPHCRRLYVRQHAALKHEVRCIRNPQRTPRDGEITHCDQWECIYILDDVGTPIPERYSDWHPGRPGMIWFRDEWVVVPGWKPDASGTCDVWPCIHYHGGFGRSWDYPGDPDCDVPLNEVSYDERIRWMEAQLPLS